MGEAWSIMDRMMDHAVIDHETMILAWSVTKQGAKPSKLFWWFVINHLEMLKIL